MNRNRRNKFIEISEIIAILAFIVSVFSICFSIYQYNDQKKQSKDNDLITEKRFNIQFKEIRKTDSEQIAVAKKNLIVSTQNFNKQFEQIRTNDSEQIAMSIYNSKNAVRPLIQVFKASTKIDNPLLGLEMTNEGFGPAIIDSLIILFDGKVNDLAWIGKFSRAIDLQCFAKDAKWGFTAFMQQQSSMKSGGSKWLFYISRDEVYDEYNFEKLLDHVDIIVKYHSLTNDHYVFHTDNTKYTSAYVRTGR